MDFTTHWLWKPFCAKSQVDAPGPLRVLLQVLDMAKAAACILRISQGGVEVGYAC